MKEEKKNQSAKSKAGRKPITDTAIFRYSVNFNAVQHVRFLSLWEESSVQSKSQFIAARVFSDEFRVIRTDRATMEYVGKLTALYAQFRAVGVNYNQVVHALNTHFSEKKSLSFLYKLEKLTVELIGISHRIIALSEEFRAR